MDVRTSDGPMEEGRAERKGGHIEERDLRTETQRPPT